MNYVNSSYDSVTEWVKNNHPQFYQVGWQKKKPSDLGYTKGAWPGQLNAILQDFFQRVGLDFRFSANEVEKLREYTLLNIIHILALKAQNSPNRKGQTILQEIKS